MRVENLHEPMMLKERRTKMRWPKTGLFLLTLLSVSAIPLSVEAFEVRFCVPNCVAATADTTTVRSEAGAPVQNPTGVFTTNLDLTGVTVAGFTVTGKAVAQQSGTLQKITFTTTRITAPTASGSCTTAAPCAIEIIATSAPDDFPLNKPTGGYPAGAFLYGQFLGPQNVWPAVGDTVSMTAEASGLSNNFSTALNNDVINATPGAGAGDTAKSLPRSCTGSAACKFTVTSSSRSTFTSIEETVQQRCEGTATSCRTRLKITLNLSFVGAGDSFTLPAGVVEIDPPAPGQGKDAIALLLQETVSPVGNLKVAKLAVGSNDFALAGTIRLDAGNSIDPATEEVYLRIGSFAMTIAEGSFTKKGRRFVFAGKVAGMDVAAAFERDNRNPLLWTFAAGVHGVQLTGLPQPPREVPVDIAVGSDRGSDLVEVSFFGI